MTDDETNDERRAKIVKPGEAMREQKYTVDHDAFLYKDTSSGYAPDAVWTMSDGTKIRPAEVVDCFAEPKAPEPGPEA